MDAKITAHFREVAAQLNRNSFKRNDVATYCALPQFMRSIVFEIKNEAANIKRCKKLFLEKDKLRECPVFRQHIVL